jgi:ubiquinone/menaquinone biosynthesis C-methylase UbiE
MRTIIYMPCQTLHWKCVITSLPLENNSVEIAIMSLALWGTQENCKQYIKEAYRVLESGGKFYISDSTKKWSPEPLTIEHGGELLRTLLIDNGFTIMSEDIGLPFCLFVCNKVY